MSNNESRGKDPKNSLSFLDAVDNMIAIGVEASDWIEAVKFAGKLLLEGGKITSRYIDAMVNTTKELGPYSVIVPGVAIPHARPEDGALDIGFSIVILKKPVKFNSPNDPVYIIIGFSAIDKKIHIAALQQLAKLLSKSNFVDRLKNARDPEEVKKLIRDTLGE